MAQDTGCTHNETTNQPDRWFQHTCSAVSCTVDMRWANCDMFIIRSGRTQGSAPAGCEPHDGQRSQTRWPQKMRARNEDRNYYSKTNVGVDLNVNGNEIINISVMSL